MIYIRINMESIHIAGTKYEKCKFVFPNDLIVQYGENEFPIDSWSVCYKFDSELLFPYLDDFERRMPKTSHSIWWDWSGIRKGTEYYIEFTATALPETADAFMDVFKEVFSPNLIDEEVFDFPDIDSSFQFKCDQEWAEEEPIDYGDDEILRALEEFSIGNNAIQWSRTSQGYAGGPDIITVLGVAAGLASFGYTFITSFKDRAMKRHYEKKIEVLLKAVMKECKNQGRFVLPEPKPPEIFNSESQEYEYVFTQILDDGRWREIYISSDGENITKGDLHGRKKKKNHM